MYSYFEVHKRAEQSKSSQPARRTKGKERGRQNRGMKTMIRNEKRCLFVCIEKTRSRPLQSLSPGKQVARWGWNAIGWASPWSDTRDDLLFGCGVIDFAGSGVVSLIACAAHSIVFRSIVSLSSGVPTIFYHTINAQ